MDASFVCQSRYPCGILLAGQLSAKSAKKALFESENMETLLSFAVGIGLSAACGFRVFVPLLAVSLASMTGHLHLSPGFEWISTYPALIAFAIATVVEVAGYYIPWVDHALDTLATPAAIVAGTIITASMATDVSPFLKWTLAVIAGGGVAGVVQGTTVLTRSASTATTGGIANPLFATIELGGAVVTSILAIVVPLIALVLVSALLYFLARRILRRTPQRPEGAIRPPLG